MKVEQAPFLTIAIVCCVAGCGFFANSIRRRRRWTFSDGVVLGYREDHDASFFPKIRFRITNGDEFTFESRCSGSPKRVPVGSHVRVLYSPEHPSNAEVLSFSNFWLLPIFSLGFGLTFTLVGILIGIYA
jgi:Protein of unknown function (DUF3592)